MSISAIGMSVAEAGNSSDTAFGFNYYDTTGREVAIDSRTKQDYTSSYVYNRDSYQAIDVNVWSTNKSDSI